VLTSWRSRDSKEVALSIRETKYARKKLMKIRYALSLKRYGNFGYAANGGENE
jgi:hypothetical protein